VKSTWLQELAPGRWPCGPINSATTPPPPAPTPRPPVAHPGVVAVAIATIACAPDLGCEVAFAVQCYSTLTIKFEATPRVEFPQTISSPDRVLLGGWFQVIKVLGGEPGRM